MRFQEFKRDAMYATAKPILEASSYYTGRANQFVMRENVQLEKGVQLTESEVTKYRKLFERYGEFFVAYPDLFLDLITPTDSGFKLFFFQRLTLRAMMRHKTVVVIAPRAFSKSFLTILALFLQCIFFPGTKRFICLPMKNQGAKVAKEKLTEIFAAWPLLRKEVIGSHLQSKAEVPGNYGADYVELNLKNGSKFLVVGTTSATRGGRAHGGLIDELRKIV